LISRRADRKAEALFVVEGEQLLMEATRAGWEVREVYLAAEVSDDGHPNAVRLAQGVMERVASTESPQPLLALVERRVMALPPTSGWVVVADRIADPGNLGTIIRSAEAAGASAVVLPRGTVDAFNPKVVRASAGAIFHVGIVEDIELSDVKKHGFRLVGTTSHGGPSTTEYRRADLSGPVAVVLGNEAHGLDADAPIDQWLTITHFGRSESLNVAMAGTLVCFAVAAQHQPASFGD